MLCAGGKPIAKHLRGGEPPVLDALPKLMDHSREHSGVLRVELGGLPIGDLVLRHDEPAVRTRLEVCKIFPLDQSNELVLESLNGVNFHDLSGEPNKRT
jgi:hypothetical protein